eukprot:Em0008g964a
MFSPPPQVRVCATVAVEVKKSQHKYIIGPKGQGLHDILTKTGEDIRSWRLCKEALHSYVRAEVTDSWTINTDSHQVVQGVWVDVPSQDTESNTITLRGPQEKLGIALTQVYEKANSVVMQEVDAPGWLHRFIIGRKGQNVQKITQDLPRVHVEFNFDLNKIILEGPPGEVTQAAEAFVTFTEDLVATMDFAEINIDQKYHRHIIGKGGANDEAVLHVTWPLPHCWDMASVSLLEHGLCLTAGTWPLPHCWNMASASLLEHGLCLTAGTWPLPHYWDMASASLLEHGLCLTAGTWPLSHYWNMASASLLEHGLCLTTGTWPLPHCWNMASVSLLEHGLCLTAGTWPLPHCWILPVQTVEEGSVWPNLTGEADYGTPQGHSCTVLILWTLIPCQLPTVSRIKNETGTSIIIPPDENKSDVIRIEGDPKGVAAAKAMLLEMAAKMENERTKDLIIDQRLHKQIIGSKGETIKEIRDRFNGLQVGFPSPGEKKDIVTLRGPKDDVDKCAAYLKKLCTELDAASYHEDIKVFKKFHGSIIGKGGANLKKIRDETSTRIIIPSENSDSDMIGVTGRKENVEKARAMIKAIEKEMVFNLTFLILPPFKLAPLHFGAFAQLLCNPHS